MKNKPSETTLEIRRMVRVMRLRAKIDKARESQQRAITRHEERIAQLENQLGELGIASFPEAE